ncbi:MAG: response regulator [Desulfamplus sp.]|nr:response regulator [Desulfamplus sp.]
MKNNKPRFFFNIRTKLLVAFVLLTLVPFFILGVLFFINSKKAISSAVFNQLTSIRDTKKVQVENFFTEQHKHLGFLVDAVKNMQQAAFQSLNTVQNRKKSELVKYFDNCVSDIRVLSTNGSVRSALADFSSVIDSNDNFDRSLYDFFESVKYGSLLRKFTDIYQYYDLMLVNRDGKIVFSIKKESDLGRNIFNTTFLNHSALVNCFARTMRSSNIKYPAINFVVIEDFQKYAPSGGRHIAFIGAPILEGNGTTPAGAVILKIDTNAVYSIVQNRQDMGKKGETCIMGDANGIVTYRSDQLLKQGRTGQKVLDRDPLKGIDMARKNKFAGPLIEYGANGEIEIARYDALEIPGLQWIIATSMSLEELIAPAESKKEEYFSRYVSVYGFSDLMLISARGDIFYSVAGSPEYGKNIADKPLAQTSIGKLFQKIYSTGQFAFVGFSSSYDVSGTDVSLRDSIDNQPFAFIGEPLFENGIMEMIVALKIPLDMINWIMHEDTGLGTTGDVYLIGPDKFSRSSFVPYSSLNASRSGSLTSGFTYSDIDMATYPGVRFMDSQAITSALSGVTGEEIIKDHNRVEVLSAYAPVKVFGLDWAIIAEIEKSKAFADLEVLKRNAFIVAILSFGFIIFISFLISRHFAKPIDQLILGVKQIKSRNFDINVYLQTNDELEVLAEAFNEMASEIKKYSEELELKAKEIKRYSYELESKVTILENMEADLRRSNTLLNAVMNGTTDMIFIKDRKGRYIMANPSVCKAFGKTMDELILNRSKDVLPFETAESIEKADSVVLETGRNIMSEIKMPAPDEKTQWWLTNKSPYRDTDGNIIGIIGIARDITEHKVAEQERKKLELQLRQAQKMDAIGTLAAGVAHDFNNILSAIQGYSEMVMYELPEFSSEKMSLEKVLYACHRAKQLIRQILTFSRTSSDDNLSELDMHDIVQEAVQLIRASTPTTIEIDTDISQDCGTALGDPTQIYQVIMNICTNAAHAMDEKGGVMTVSLKAEELKRSFLNGYSMNGNPVKPGRYITLSVQDTGKGIAPENMDRIFDPYFTTKPPGKGSGMGLAVAHGIVKNSGGTITVKSSPGKGTAFKIWFPRIQKQLHTMGSLESSAKGDIKVSTETGITDTTELDIIQTSDGSQACFDIAPKERGQTDIPVKDSVATDILKRDKDGVPVGDEHILVVDDEPDMVEITTHRLENLGYRITGMTSSHDALVMFEAMPHKFDLLITDQTMPKLTGIELAQKVMSIRPEMPVILCTGYSAKVNSQKAQELGIREFLTKPVEYRELAFAVRRVLDQAS